MLVTGIKSKPVYTPLSADTRGRYHLMLGAGAGDAALLRVLGEMQASAPQALPATWVLLAPPALNGSAAAAAPAAATPASTELDPAPAAEWPAERFQRLGLGEFRVFVDTSALLAEFKSMLARALMGTRLYVAGPESFIGLAMRIALEFNLNKDEIRAEELGSAARRVYCVHCRTTAESVRTNIVQCAGCGLWLLVRDHYSRRLAAYMGVMVDAEAPGELPPIKEVFV